MHRAVAAVVLAAALAACAPGAERGATGRGAQRAAAIEGISEPGSVIEPGAAQPTLEGLRPGEELLVVLPGPEGSSGAVVVHSADREVLVDRPYAAARVRTDGMVESSMLHAAAVDAQFRGALSALPQKPAVFTLYFSQKRKDRFTEGSLARLEELLGVIAKRPVPEISITGHTDSTGSPSGNDKVSLVRANRARDELVRRGIPARHIVSVAGRGERELLVPTADGVAEARNRRVEISVR